MWVIKRPPANNKNNIHGLLARVSVTEGAMTCRLFARSVARLALFLCYPPGLLTAHALGTA